MFVRENTFVCHRKTIQCDNVYIHTYDIYMYIHMYMNIKVFFSRNMKISVVKETNVTQKNNMKLSAAHLNIHTLMFDIISIVGFYVFFCLVIC